jgi:hypothetical protein
MTVDDYFKQAVARNFGQVKSWLPRSLGLSECDRALQVAQEKEKPALVSAEA